MNSQKPEKAVKSDGTTLDVHSVFDTIQGEGPFAGTPAVFIRLAGCNLQCPQCDTEYTQGRRSMSVPTLLSHVRSFDGRRLYRLEHPAFTALAPKQSKLVVITGGEPFRQNLEELCLSLMLSGYFVQIETNGSLPPTCGQLHISKDIGERDGIYIVCSPKAGKVAKATESAVCAFKYVGDHTCLSAVDGLPLAALRHPANPQLARPPVDYEGLIYLQPTDFSMSEDPRDPFSILEVQGKNNLAVQACVESCMRFGYIMQLQTHKILRVP